MDTLTYTTIGLWKSHTDIRPTDFLAEFLKHCSGFDDSFELKI